VVNGILWILQNRRSMEKFIRKISFLEECLLLFFEVEKNETLIKMNEGLNRTERERRGKEAKLLDMGFFVLSIETNIVANSNKLSCFNYVKIPILNSFNLMSSSLGRGYI
jgi:hypothetical protein